MTYPQCRRLTEVIEAKKRRELRMLTVSMAMAAGLGMGAMDQRGFDEFIDQIYEAESQEENLNAFLDKAKADGLPIEDV